MEGAPDLNDDDWEPDPGRGSDGRALMGRAAGRLLVDAGLVAARAARAAPPDEHPPPRRAAAGGSHVPEGVADLAARRLRRRR